MKTLLLLLFGALCLPMFGSPHQRETKNTFSISNTETFFDETGDVLDYGSLYSPLEYQGQEGITFASNEGNGEVLLSQNYSKWVSGENKESSIIDGSLFNPGKNILVYSWTAPKTGTYTIKGLLYNHYAFTSTEDLSAYNVAPRIAQTSGTRDGVTLSASFSSSFTTNYSGNYETRSLTTDYKLFVNKAYFCTAGDSLKIYINGNIDYTDDDVSIYMDVKYSTPITSFTFTGTDSQVFDSLGTSNSICANPGAKIKYDSTKGVHFGNNAADDNLKFFVDPNFANTDFTDYLTEFSVHVRFTIEGELDDWTYIFSTTSHEGTQSTRGFALGLNKMYPEAYDNGRLKYCLQVRANEKGTGFFSVTNGWINDLHDGGTYDVYVNCSTRLKKIEAFCSGPYNSDYPFTNASGTSAMILDDSWTMYNPGYHGLTMGCFNEAGEQQFHGWISQFEVFDNFYHYDKDPSLVVGPARASEVNPISVTGVQTLSPINFRATVEELINEAPNEVELTLSDSSKVNDSIVWNNNPICIVGEYYLIGTTNTKFPGKCWTVKVPIDAAVVTLVRNLRYESITAYAPGAKNELPKTNGGIYYEYYTDKEMTSEFTSDTFTASTKIYVISNYITYYINYVLDGGINNDANPSTFTIKDVSIYLYDPSKEGYTFDGWYLEDTFENKVTEIDCLSLSSVTVYAKWIKNNVKPNTNKKGINMTPIIVVSAICGSVILIAGAVTVIISIKRKKAKE